MEAKWTIFLCLNHSDNHPWLWVNLLKAPLTYYLRRALWHHSSIHNFPPLQAKNIIKHIKLSKPNLSFTNSQPFHEPPCTQTLSHTHAINTKPSPHTLSLHSANTHPPNILHHRCIFPHLTTYFTPCRNGISWSQGCCAFQQALLSPVRLSSSYCQFCYKFLQAVIANPHGGPAFGSQLHDFRLVMPSKQ